jgi:hypothetical protein
VLLYENCTQMNTRWFPFCPTLDIILSDKNKITLQSALSKKYFFYSKDGYPKTCDKIYKDYNVFTLKKITETTYQLIDPSKRKLIISNAYDDVLEIKKFSNCKLNGFSIKSLKYNKYLGSSSDGSVLIYDDDLSWDTRWFLNRYFD